MDLVRRAATIFIGCSVLRAVSHIPLSNNRKAFKVLLVVSCMSKPRVFTANGSKDQLKETAVPTTSSYRFTTLLLQYGVRGTESNFVIQGLFQNCNLERIMQECKSPSYQLFLPRRLVIRQQCKFCF